MKCINFLLVIVCVSYCFHGVDAQNKNSGYVEYLGYFPSKKANPKPVESFLYFNENVGVTIDNKKSRIRTSTKRSPDDLEISINLPYGDTYGRQIYRNLKDSTVITRRPKNVISEPFVVEEAWVDIEWEIKNETKKIGNYSATKAVGDFRGRTYTAWFTYEIPVPFGPWKLHGLPGLIIEAEDSERMMRFYATTIKIPFDTQDIIKEPTAANRLTHKEEVYLSDNFDKLLAKKMNSRLPKGSKITPKPNNDGRKYKAEKIYEWEIEVINEKKN